MGGGPTWARLFSVGVLLAACAAGEPAETRPLFWTGFGNPNATDWAADSGGDGWTGSDGESGGGDETNGAAGEVSARCDKIDVVFVLESPVTDPEECPPLDYDIAYDEIEAGFRMLTHAMVADLGVSDFRVLVTVSVPQDISFGHIHEEDYCGPALPPSDALDVDDCDTEFAAGRNGYGGGPLDCMARRYVSSEQPADVVDAMNGFDCVVSNQLRFQPLFEFGDQTQDTLMDATLAALQPDSEAALCNSGFLRDDALLVVVLLELDRDRVPDSSSGDVADWRDALVGVKNGDESRVVVLGLVSDEEMPHAQCDGGASPGFSADVRELIDGMTYGHWAPSCLLDFGTFFDAGAAVVGSACNDFGLAP